MKIAFDNQIFGLQRSGGISRYFVELANAIKEIEIDLDIRIISPIHFNRYLNQRKEDKNIYIPRSTEKLNFNKNIRNISTALARLYLNVFDPDLIHETFYSPTDLWQNKYPRVITVFDLIREKQGVSNTRLINKRTSIERAEKIICISESTQNDLLKFYDVNPSNVSVIHLGVRREFFDSLNNKERKKQILFVGQRADYKNFPLLLEAFAKFSQDLTEYRLVCFGGGEFTRDEFNKIVNLGLEDKVTQFGGDDVLLRRTYNESEIFVSTSLDEGFGLPILEALASRVKVVCSDISVYREIGANVVEYFDPFDAESLANTLSRTIENSIHDSKVLEDGVERSRRFTWESCALKTLKVYDSVIKL
jgi:glycosyltransferase involved in cell wall biosynthesis